MCRSDPSRGTGSSIRRAIGLPDRDVAFAVAPRAAPAGSGRPASRAGSRSAARAVTIRRVGRGPLYLHRVFREDRHDGERGRPELRWPAVAGRRPRRARRAEPRPLRQRPRSGGRPLDHARLQGHDHDEGLAGQPGRALRDPPAWLGAVDVREAAARRRPGGAGLAAPHLGTSRVPAQLAGRLPLPLPARLSGHVDPSPDPLAARLRVLRGVRGEGGRGPLALASRDRAASGGRRAVHPAGRAVADERLVVHLDQRAPVALVVLARIDRILAPLTWVAAAFAVLVLFVGPALIGAKKDGDATESAAAGATAPSGKAVFASAGCGGCHTLAAAGSSGRTGPNLDAAKPSADAAKGVGASGSGGQAAV